MVSADPGWSLVVCSGDEYFQYPIVAWTLNNHQHALAVVPCHLPTGPKAVLTPTGDVMTARGDLFDSLDAWLEYEVRTEDSD